MKGQEHSKKENRYPVGMQKCAKLYNMQKAAKQNINLCKKEIRNYKEFGLEKETTDKFKKK